MPSVTVTTHDADIFAFSFDVALIVATPSATAVTMPSALTVATPSSEELHVTPFSVAFSGKTVATRESISPFSIVAFVSLSEIPVTLTNSVYTLTSHATDCP